MANGSSRFIVYGALASNILIVIGKLIAAAFTGSSSMFAEAVHSFVDSGNGALLLYGQHRSKAKADELHPFGHSREVYFWTLIVAVMIFAVGGGISIYQGVLRIRSPHAPEHLEWNYGLLAAAFVFEGCSLAYALYELGRKKGLQSYWQAIRASKDPGVFAIIFEDSAALIGLVIAFVGLFLSDKLHAPVLDGVASLLIGILLGVVALLLVREAKDLLVGEGVSSEELRSIRELVRKEEAVEQIGYPFTMYLGPDDALLAMDLQFHPEMNATEIEASVVRIEQAIQKRHPAFRHFFLETKRLRRPLASGIS